MELDVLGVSVNVGVLDFEREAERVLVRERETEGVAVIVGGAVLDGLTVRVTEVLTEGLLELLGQNNP